MKKHDPPNKTFNALEKPGILICLNKSIGKYLLLLTLALSPLSMSSCTTDAYGNTAVTPGGAAAIGIGAATAGAITAATISNHNDKHHYHHNHRPPHGRPHHWHRRRH